MVADISKDKTELGNYFIANYPPFSFWKPEFLGEIESAFARPPEPASPPMGLYLHIPFCRKRCKFCYFRVYTDVNAQAIQDYVDALSREIEIVSDLPAIQGRSIQFVYFGGGTPSYLSAKQLVGLADRLRRHITWDLAEEVTFECEPGTLSDGKLQTIRDIGVTRLSLGVENFNDAILEENGRAHLSSEISKAWDTIQRIGFAQTNIDLIAGMVGETWDNWRDNIRKVIDYSPDSVTIYQMELPFNTRYSKSILSNGAEVDIATWSTKRDWLAFAFDELCGNGYKIGSAYTLVKEGGENTPKFLYRDNLWRGADLLATGVASFGHLAGVHYQNLDGLENYQASLAQGKLPLGRALSTTPRERLIRELILQFKMGWLDLGYFQTKFGVSIVKEFQSTFDELVDRGLATIGPQRVELNREGLLRVDSLLPAFFLPDHRTDRYT